MPIPIIPFLITLSFTIIFGILFHYKISKVSKNRQEIIQNEKQHHIISFIFVLSSLLLAIDIMVLMLQNAITTWILGLIVILFVASTLAG